MLELTADEFCEATGISVSQFHQQLDRGVITPVSSYRYDPTGFAGSRGHVKPLTITGDSDSRFLPCDDDGEAGMHAIPCHRSKCHTVNTLVSSARLGVEPDHSEACNNRFARVSKTGVPSRVLKSCLPQAKFLKRSPVMQLKELAKRLALLGPSLSTA